MAVVSARKRRKLSPPEESGSDVSVTQLVEKSDAPGVDAFFANASRWNLEQNYETRPRKVKKQKESTRLPIKTAEGRVEQLEVVQEIKDEEQDGWLGSGEENASDNEGAVEIKEEIPRVPFRQQIIEAKEELARIATLINEDPEEHANAFKTLAQIASRSNATVRKLALATQLAVFKDVIPGYRIRPIADSDMTEKVSKDIRKLRAFEQSLVASYQKYVQDLAKHAKKSRGDVSEEAASLATVAISCACALLLAVPHFNFRGDLIKILVDKLSGHRVDADFVKCRETFEALFRDDEDGTPSLDTVTMLSRMMKARNYRIDESVLNTFLHLRLLSEFNSKGSQNYIDKPIAEDGPKGKKPKFRKEFRTKKQRKELKERKAIDKEFKEADAVVTHEERDRMQAETLKLVFVTYFRILKLRSPPLMGAVLEGLAKYAHLINQDFFGDLLEALKDLTTTSTLSNPLSDTEDENEDEDDHSHSPLATHAATRSSLLCTTTAFALLEGQDAARAAPALALDLSFFITHLYRSLHALALDPNLELSARSHLPSPDLPSTALNRVNLSTTPALLLRALRSTLLPPAAPRAVPPLRVAAFSKQLMTSALHLPEKSAIATLGLMEGVVKAHGRKIAGLWDTEERRGEGVWRAEGVEVEGSNPFAATVWEGELLRLHWSKGVRGRADGVERGIKEVGKG